MIFWLGEWARKFSATPPPLKAETYGHTTWALECIKRQNNLVFSTRIPAAIKGSGGKWKRFNGGVGTYGQLSTSTAVRRLSLNGTSGVLRNGTQSIIQHVVGPKCTGKGARFQSNHESWEFRLLVVPKDVQVYWSISWWLLCWRHDEDLTIMMIYHN